MSKVYIETLGCAKNTVYSEYMAGLMAEHGHELTVNPEMADTIIVNTCGFITAAKEESIQALLDLSIYKEEGRCKQLIAMGCLVQKYADELAEAMPELDMLVGTTSYDELIEKLGTDELLHTPMVNKDWRLPAAIGYQKRKISTPDHYAYLSIAEGCNNRCSYCAIPEMQGPYRSRAMNEILLEAKKLVHQGYHELIIIAQDTTYYGLDLYQKPMLASLLEQLSDIEGLHWIRILYAYPDHFTDELIDVMKRKKNICRYIDMPLQHANNHILQEMRRHITQEEILNLIEKLRTAMPDIRIRSTFITGFPGETEDEYQDLLSFIQDAKLDRVGVFAYSQEENTPAGMREDQIPESIKEERAANLMEVQFDVMNHIHRSWIGQTLEIKVEEKSEDIEDLLLCRSFGEAPDIDPFILVTDTSKKLKVGDFTQVRIVDLDEYDLVGELLYEFT